MSGIQVLEPDADFQTLEGVFLTEEEYLATEPARLERHEYIDGQIRAMAGASDSHEGVANHLNHLIYAHLRGKPCRVYKGDMKLRVQQHTQARKVVFYYPDIMVVCDPADDHSLFKTKPRLIVEVLSHDKGRDLIEKLAVYREIATLEEYLVVSQHSQRPEVTAFRRRTGFEPEILQDGAFDIECIGLSLTVRALYEY